MRNVGKVTIQLLDGEGYGKRLVEIGNWVGKAYFAPRNLLAELLIENEDTDKPGVYCLKYLDPENGREIVYIGEADNLAVRLRSHLANKDKNHFVEAMFFISHNDWLTKTQVKYLEHKLVKLALERKAQILNRNAPSRPRIQGSEINDLEDFLERILLLLPIMGFKFMIDEPLMPTVVEFDPGDFDEDEESSLGDFTPPKPKLRQPRSKPQELVSEPKKGRKDAAELVSKSGDEVKSPNLTETDEFQPKISPFKERLKELKQFMLTESVIGAYRIVDKTLKATMDVDDNGYFVVRKGSQARKHTSNSIDGRYLMIRSMLIEAGILQDMGEYFEFMDDYTFTSASAASNVVVGRQSPGPRMWVDFENRSLRGFINDPIA